MLGETIPTGALFYGRTRRRLDVVFDEELRRETEEAARLVHELIASGKTPKPLYAKKCDLCSLLDLCNPKAFQKKRSVRQYLDRMTEEP
mgnify:CR=1 FL=1